MSWYKRPMFKDAVNMQIGGMVPLPRMQAGTGPMGIASVSPELFSSAEFMGEPLNQISEAGAGIPGAGFFPEGNFGAPAVTDAGIVAGLEEMSVEPEVKENKLELAKQQAMSIFDQKFDEAMSIMQAQMVAGGMPMQDMEMILSDEIEVMEGQAEATVKEAMNLPEEVDLIPAEVAQSYLEKARMIVSGPKQEPSMDMPMDMPMDMGNQAVQKMFAGSLPSGVQPVEEEDDDPLSIIKEMEKQSIASEEEMREREAEAARKRRDELDTKIRAGDFSKEFMTDWTDLKNLAAEVRDVAERKAMRTPSYSPAVSTMGGKWLDALSTRPKMAKLAGDEAALEYDKEIKKLQQAEQQALLQGDAAMLRAVYQQGQKIEDQLSNTLMQNIGDIRTRTIGEAGDILTKQIGDQEDTATMRSQRKYMDMIINPDKYTKEEVINARNQMEFSTAAKEAAKTVFETYSEKWASMGEKDQARGITAKDRSEKEAFMREELPGFYEWSKQTYGKEFWPNDALFRIRYEEFVLDSSQGASKTWDLDAMGIGKDQVNALIEAGLFSSGDSLKSGDKIVKVP